MRACFLHLHVCDVIKYRDDHGRMRISDPLVPLAGLRGGRIMLISYVPSIKERLTVRIEKHRSTTHLKCGFSFDDMTEIRCEDEALFKS